MTVSVQRSNAPDRTMSQRLYGCRRYAAFICRMDYRKDAILSGANRVLPKTDAGRPRVPPCITIRNVSHNRVTSYRQYVLAITSANLIRPTCPPAARAISPRHVGMRVAVLSL